MTNEAIFDEIFYDICGELNKSWYQLFDSNDYDLVIKAIGEHFGVDNPHLVEGYDEWHNRMRGAL